jgi:hypothetical protein
MGVFVRRAVLPVLVAAAATLSVLPSTSAQAASVIQLGRIQYDSPGVDNHSATSLDAEYVTVRNTGSRPVTLTRWTLRDVARHVYTFPAVSVPAHGAVIVHTGSGRNHTGHLYWGRGAYIWNNTGDTAVLRTSTGAAADSCRWTRTTPGYVNC